MTFIARLYPGDAFVLTAFNALIQITLVTTLALLASRTLARRNAALRHSILFTALLWTILSPLVASRINQAAVFKINLPATSPIPDTVTSFALPSADPQFDSVPTLTLIVAHDASASTTLISSPPQPAPAPKLPPLVLAVSTAILLWIAVWSILMIRFLAALRAVSRIRRTSHPADSLTEPLLHNATQNLPSHPPILISDRIRGPVTIGIYRRAILLPSALLHEISPNQLRDVLIHECVHAARHDYAVGILQRLVGAALWFHPIVHLLNRDLRRAREEVCDNAVLRGGNPAAYARTLLDLSQRIGIAPTPKLLPGLFDATWPLEHRVAGILNQRRIVMTHVNRPTRVAIASVIAVLGLSLSIVTPGTAQSARTEQAALPLLPSETQSSPTTSPATPERFDLYKSLQRPEIVNQEEETIRAAEQQTRMSIQKAELDLREAEIKHESQKIDLKRKEELFANKNVSASEVDEARLNISLAEVQLQRAKLALMALSNVSVTRSVTLTIYDRNDRATQQYTVRGFAPSVKDFVNTNFAEASRGDWEIQITRTTSHEHLVVFNPWLSSRDRMFANERIQTGDRICVRRDIVAVSVNAKTIWSAPLHGQKIRLTAMLEKAGIKLDPADTSRYEIRGGELRSLPLRPPQAVRPSGSSRTVIQLFTLGQLADGDAPDEQLEAGDSINIIRSN